MASPLVTTHRQWRHLLRDLTSAHPVLRTLPQQVAQFVLASPVAVARWIATQRTDLLGKDELKILVAGVAGPDSVDAGAWYAFLPMLLGKPNLGVQLSFVGIEAGQSATTKIALNGIRRWPIHSCSLEKFLEDHDPAGFDICFVFHPGLEAHYKTWLGENNGLTKLTKANVQCVFASYAKDEYLMDAGYLSLFGLDSTEAVENPFCVDGEHGIDDTKFAHYLWAAAPEPYGYDQVEATAFANRIGAASNLMAYFLQLNQKLGLPNDEYSNVGKIITVASSLDDDDTFAVLYRDVAIRLRDYELYKLEEGGLFSEKLGIPVDGMAVNTHPGKTAPWIERIVWATDVWVGYVNPELQRRPLLSGTVLMGSDCKPDFKSMTQAMQASGQDVDEEIMNALGNVPTAKRHVMTASDKFVFNMLEQGKVEAIIDQLPQNPLLVQALNQNLQTILFEAINLGRSDLLQAAIAAGADVNHRDNEGWSPLHHASNRQANTCLHVLINAPGIRLNEVTDMGWPALLISISHGCFGNALALVKAGASVKQQNPMGMNALDFVKQLGKGVLPEELIQAIQVAA